MPEKVDCTNFSSQSPVNGFLEKLELFFTFFTASLANRPVA